MQSRWLLGIPLQRRWCTSCCMSLDHQLRTARHRMLRVCRMSAESVLPITDCKQVPTEILTLQRSCDAVGAGCSRWVVSEVASTYAARDIAYSIWPACRVACAAADAIHAILCRRRKAWRASAGIAAFCDKCPSAYAVCAARVDAIVHCLQVVKWIAPKSNNHTARLTTACCGVGA